MGVVITKLAVGNKVQWADDRTGETISISPKSDVFFDGTSISIKTDHGTKSVTFDELDGLFVGAVDQAPANITAVYNSLSTLFFLN